MTYFEQVEVIAKTAKVACNRPLTPTERTAFGLLFTLCEKGKELEAENADLQAQIKELSNHAILLEVTSILSAYRA